MLKGNKIDKTRINVLLVNAGLGNGGVETFLLNLIKTSDLSKFHYDLLSIYKSPYLNMENYLKTIGSNIYAFNLSNVKFYRLLQLLFKYIYFLHNRKYDVIHVNTGSLLIQVISVIAFRLMRIKKVICHSHSANPNGSGIIYSMFSSFCKRLVMKYSHKQVSCSRSASRTLFKSKDNNLKNILVINNGIDLDKFKFSIKIRDKYLNDYALRNKFVVGHIANLYKPKNQLFLIDIFYHIQKRLNNAILIIVGDGEYRNRINDRIKELGIENKVLMLGYRTDISNLLMCMDVFVLPSLYEGFPITLVEAQATGLPCIISDAITSEVKLTDLVKIVGLSETAEKWCNEIINYSSFKPIRENYNILLKQKGFDIKNSYAKVFELYE